MYRCSIFSFLLFFWFSICLPPFTNAWMILFMQLFFFSDFWQRLAVSVMLWTRGHWIYGWPSARISLPLKPRASHHLEQFVKDVMEWSRGSLFRGQVSVHYVIFMEDILEAQSLASQYIKGRTKDKGSILNLSPILDIKQHKFSKGQCEWSVCRTLNRHQPSPMCLMRKRIKWETEGIGVR